MRSTAEVRAAPLAVYLALVDQVGASWDADHTWSGRASNLTIDGRAGGCFCEKLPDGSVQHMAVVWADRGKTLRLTGALGPLQAMAVSGAMTWTLTESAGGAMIEITYTVGGYAPDALEALAKPVDAVLAAQLQRLKRFIETGRPQ